MMKRILYSPKIVKNHFGVLIELSNQERFLIHNSPYNEGFLGQEIIIDEIQMSPGRWEVHTQWK